MANLVKVRQHEDESIKWIIKDGVEKVERTLSENTASVTYNEPGYLEFKNKVGYNQFINWDADTLK